jgi:hypothetical protein
MVQLSRAERALVDDLLECIATAMSRVEDVDSAYANKTKLQKLLYMAIDKFDLPITYSWYLAGAVLPDDPATPETLKSAFDRLPSPDSPSIDDQPETMDESVLPGVDASVVERASSTEQLDELRDSLVDDAETATSDEEDDTIDPVLFSGMPTPETSPGDDPTDGRSIGDDQRDEIIDFYVSVLPGVWSQSTMRFLQNFYLEHAPQGFRDLYVQSTHLRVRLGDIEEAVEAHLDEREPSESIPELVHAAGLDISDLHVAIRSSDTLARTFEGFVDGTDTIEDGLMMISQKAPDQLTEDHLDAIRSLQDFFYYWVWRYPCLIISQETATGPSAEALRTERQQRLVTFESELRERIDAQERELTSAGLRPHYSDYPALDDDVEETITDLTGRYLRN